MVIFLKFFKYISIILFLASCATGGLKTRKQLRNLIVEKNYDAALELLQESKFYKDPDNRLLLEMELGSIYHFSEKFLQSSIHLENALSEIDKLYTKSVSKKTAKWLLNDNLDKFYGLPYEHSLVYFYLSLDYLTIYQLGVVYEKSEKGWVKKSLNESDRRKFLFKARATLVAWDTYLKELKELKIGKGVFKDDLLAKTYGAIVHEIIGSRNDLQIALQLYKDAKQLVLKNYNLYDSYNLKYKNFQKDYSKLKSVSINKLEKEYIGQTNLSKDLNSYLDLKIVELTKKVRPYEYSKLSKKLNVKVPKKLPNVTFLFQNKILPRKTAKKHYYGIQDDGGIGLAIMASFAADKLGLFPAPNTYRPGRTFIGYNMGKAALQNVAVSFELPTMRDSKSEDNLKLIIKKQNQVVKKVNLNLIAPVNKVAMLSLEEDSLSRYFRIGARLATKHAAAIAAAYATYKALNKNGKNEFVAKNLAVLEYIGATKVIQASEKADTRHWSGLPFDIRMGETFLSSGIYSIELTNGKHSRILGQFAVDESRKKQIINLR